MLLRKNLSNKARSKVSEKRAAELFNGKLQPASGALPSKFLKADVKSATFLVDDKTTIHESYSIKTSTWQKLSGEAWTNNRRPAMRLEFGSGLVLVVLDATTFQEMNNCYEKTAA